MHTPLLLYRGDSKKHLRKQLFIDPGTQNPDGQMYAKLFYFGQKARHFWMEKDRDIHQREWLKGVWDHSDTTFAWLFKEIRRVLKYSYRRVKRFCDENPALSEYFNDESNGTDFIAQVMQESPKKRQIIRDYYLHLLHTYGRNGIHKATLLVSASSDLRVASSFRKDGAENVVLYMFSPAPYTKYCVSSRFRPKDIGVVMDAGLPLYKRNSGIYPGQKEYGFRGAIFPHLIFGVYDQATDDFIVNPHLLAMNGHSMENLYRNGIRVEQNQFENMIKKTGFHRFVIVDESGLYHGQDKGQE